MAFTRETDPLALGLQNTKNALTTLGMLKGMINQGVENSRETLTPGGFNSALSSLSESMEDPVNAAMSFGFGTSTPLKSSAQELASWEKLFKKYPANSPETKAFMSDLERLLARNPEAKTSKPQTWEFPKK